MKSHQRSKFVAVLLAIICAASVLHAQDEALTIVGSGVVMPAIERIAEASNLSDQTSFVRTGTNDGIAQFCAGTADLVATTRPLSVEEDTLCKTNNIAYQEYLVANAVVTVIINTANDLPTCLPIAALDDVLAPSASGRLNNWNLLDETYGDLPLSVFVPEDNSFIYVLADQIISGDGLRVDAERLNASDIISRVGETPGAIGLIDFDSPTVGELALVAIDFGNGCIMPSVESVEDRQYQAGTRLFVYARAQENETQQALIAALVDEANIALIAQDGLSSASSAAYASNQTIAAEGRTGRQFSRDVIAFEIPQFLSGTVAIGGSGVLHAYANQISSSLTQTQTGLTINFNVEGTNAGARRLCNGELDILLTVDALNSDQLAACEANNITPITWEVGTQAVVMVANAADSFASCLTLDQINTIWGAASTGIVENWSDLGEGFASADMTLFGINAGNSASDLLLSRPGQPTPPVRVDTELNNDPLYRAAAVANVPGSLTYMSWTDYQRVLNNGQQRIQLVEVNSGNGCIAPSEATITDQTYALSRQIYLTVARESLTRIEVQSYLWTFFSDQNFFLLDRQGLIGLTLNDMGIFREQLQNAFTEAAEASAVATPEVEEVEPSEESPEETPEAEATEAAG